MKNRKKLRQARREEGVAGAVIRAFFIIIGIILLVCMTAFTSYAGDDMEFDTLLAMQKLNYQQKLSYLAVLAVVDYRQTVTSVVARPDQYQELNPVLGPHPGRKDLLIFGGAGIACVWAIAEYLPDGWIKPVIVDSIVATEQVNVRENRDVDLYGSRRTGMPLMVVFSTNF